MLYESQKSDEWVKKSREEKSLCKWYICGSVSVTETNWVIFQKGGACRPLKYKLCAFLLPFFSLSLHVHIRYPVYTLSIYRLVNIRTARSTIYLLYCDHVLHQIYFIYGANHKEAKLFLFAVFRFAYTSWMQYRVYWSLDWPFAVLIINW